jgi:hypothetical protein
MEGGAGPAAGRFCAINRGVRVRPAEPEAVNLLELSPVRTAHWREQDGRVVVERLPPPVRGLGRLLLHFSFLSGAKRLRLDELGAAVWRRLDGCTVAEVAAGLRAEFGERCEPAEERLRLYLGILRRERLIGLPGLDDAAIAEWRARPAEKGTPE